MTVDEDLRELADHELDVMRGRLVALASKWEKEVDAWPGMLVPMRILGVRALQLRNVLAGRDAEDDGA